jgi:hypothetical protein
VQQYVGIGVAKCALGMRDEYTTQPKFSTLNQFMEINPLSYSVHMGAKVNYILLWRRGADAQQIASCHSQVLGIVANLRLAV